MKKIKGTRKQYVMLESGSFFEMSSWKEINYCDDGIYMVMNDGALIAISPTDYRNIMTAQKIIEKNK